MTKAKQTKSPALKNNPYMPQEDTQTLPQGQPAAAEESKAFYRFNLKMPLECKDYLQEMAWRNRISITEYLTRIVLADKDAHPEWKETIDTLNT